MAIIFSMNEIGKVKIFPYGISDGVNVIACKSEEHANNLLANSRYEGYSIINSDKPTDRLLETLKGVRFDSFEDAEMFINGGGYEESVTARVEDLECMMAEMIGGDEQ